MKFDSDSAKMKFNAGMSKKALEDGYDIVPSEGQFFAGTMANKRLRLTDPWEEVGMVEPDDMED